MRLLFYKWFSNTEDALQRALERAGHELYIVEAPCKNYIKDMELSWQMIQVIQRDKVEGIISINYFPIISSVCEITGIPYYAWVYDCPHYTLFAHQAKLEYNRLFVFDKALCERLWKYNVNNVEYMPLAVDVEMYDDILKSGDRMKHRKYSCDVSFVGSMYTGEQDYFDSWELQSQLTSEEKSISNAFVGSATFAYGDKYKDLYSKFMKRKPFFESLEKKSGVRLGIDFFADSAEVVMGSILEKKITVDERCKLMRMLSQCGADFRLYTASDSADLEEPTRAVNFGPVNYMTEMPFIFYNSKININNTLKSIHTGISQRVLDIMACGGFVLTDEQPELKEYLEIGKEVVTYNSLADCLNKVKYYLEHEDERKEIAAAGKAKVLRDFNYDKALRRILADS